MSLFSCVALIMGACIGSAIFSISGVTIFYAGPAAIISWLIAAGIFGLYGVLVTRLAEIFPHSGGIYIFPRLSIGGRKGSILGFVSCCGYIVSNMIAIAFSAIYIGIYLKAGFPEIESGTAVSITAMVLSCALLAIRERESRAVQNILVVVLAAIIIFYCTFAFFGGGFDTENFENFFTAGSKGWSGFVTSVPLAMVAYGGCVVIAFIASEVRRPEMNIRRSLFIGLGGVALLYAALITAIIGTLPMSILGNDESMRYIPLFASIGHGGLSAFPWLGKVISVCVTVALFTTITALLKVNAKAVQAIGLEGLKPRFLPERKGDTRSIIIITAVCCLLCFKAGWTEEMINLGAILNIVSMTITCISLMAAKKRADVLSIVTITLLWICYIPDIVHGRGMMWIFSAAVYLLGFIFMLTCMKKVTPSVSGIVVHGKGHGHLHSIPTANLQLDEGCEMPLYGVWKTIVTIDGRKYNGMTNVGYRPTDDDSETPTVETKILGLEKDVYGKRMYIEFIEFIRGTRKFVSMDELREQIDKDMQVNAPDVTKGKR